MQARKHAVVMPKPSDLVHRLAERVEFALPENLGRGVQGERLSRGVGTSLEFQDRREYSVGDDVRHLDWRAFARTDQLLVRQYRAEIQPRLDLVLDVSGSMAVDDGKAQLAVDIAALSILVARAQGLSVRLVRAGERALRGACEELLEQGELFDARAGPMTSLPGLRAELRARSFRILISDLLEPGDGHQLVRTLAAGAGGCTIVQVLSRDDLNPQPGQLRVIDAESGVELDLVLDEERLAEYRTRVAAWNRSLREDARAQSVAFFEVDTSADIEGVALGSLMSGGLFAPR